MEAHKYIISKNTIYTIFTVICSFILTIVISPWHYGGDQIVYQKVYSNVNGLDLREALAYYSGQIASVEITHFVYIFIFSNLNIDKIYAMAFANSILGFLVVKLWIRHFKGSLPGLFFIITNYYILALFFTLERLKFGIIFILLAALTYNNIKKFLLVILSIISHLSLVVVAVLSIPLALNKNSFKLSYKYIFNITLLSIFSIGGFNYFESQINQKIPAYILVTDIQEMLFSGIKTTIFMVLSYLVVGRISLRMLAIYLPLIAMSIIVEPARINLFAYLFFLYFCTLNYKKIKTKIILSFSLLYYSISGFVYLNLLRISGG